MGEAARMNSFVSPTPQNASVYPLGAPLRALRLRLISY